VRRSDGEGERMRQRESGSGDGIEKYICIYIGQMCIYFTSVRDGNDDISPTDNIECLSIYWFSSPLKRYYLQNTTALTVNSESSCGDGEADRCLRPSTVRCTYSVYNNMGILCCQAR